MAETLQVSTGVPEGARRLGIDEAVWATLNNSQYPGARPESVIAVLMYCKARNLDPLKKPCHIVPMEVKNARTNQYEWRDVILPGIYELRTTAQRTGEYLGHSVPTWGPMIEYQNVKAFEWCALSIRRFHSRLGTPVEFPVQVYFREVVALNKDGAPNARWRRAPLQMLLKCTEAAGLREAFPDEIGGEHAAEELEGRAPELESTASGKQLPAKPEGFDEFVLALEAVAVEGMEKLRATWREACSEGSKSRPCAQFLLMADPGLWEAIKTKAGTVDTDRARALEAGPQAAEPTP